METLAIHGGDPVIELEIPHFTWPLIEESDIAAVIDQLQDTVSIYDNSGIINAFEQEWKKIHDVPFALLTNSGTSALFSLFVGIGLKDGDEIICPDYTFFATISTVMTLDVIPVFCDCDEHGNIDLGKIEDLINSKTKALVVTHMWGIPCKMDELVEICNRHSIFLLEDCSHAHGALYKGKPVGTFGDGAAWSLQGQKIVSGGEGGILVTKTKEIYYRALLLGHYNKRCRNEIPKDHPLYRFSLTGFGHKLRVHPLAVALALNQLSKLDAFLKVKREYSMILAQELQGFPFLALPYCNYGSPSWYAYVMRFDQEKSNGFTREDFLGLLHSEGLREAEAPNSTCPLSSLPVFNKNNKLDSFGNIGTIDSSGRLFPNSALFYEQAVKIPVWAREADRVVFQKYVKGIKKVSHYILNFNK